MSAEIPIWKEGNLKEDREQRWCNQVKADMKKIGAAEEYAEEWLKWDLLVRLNVNSDINGPGIGESKYSAPSGTMAGFYLSRLPRLMRPILGT